jgi:hypothetical protein
MARRKIPPLPIEGLVDSPEALTLPAAGFGMLMRLILHFWQTGCRPLPVADHELRSIARGHAPTWRRWKSSILRVFETLRPELEAAWQARENRRGNLIRLAHLGNAKRRANALKQKAAAATALSPLLPRRRPSAPLQPAPGPRIQGGFRVSSLRRLSGPEARPLTVALHGVGPKHARASSDARRSGWRFCARGP